MTSGQVIPNSVIQEDQLIKRICISNALHRLNTLRTLEGPCTAEECYDIIKKNVGIFSHGSLFMILSATAAWVQAHERSHLISLQQHVLVDRVQHYDSGRTAILGKDSALHLKGPCKHLERTVREEMVTYKVPWLMNGYVKRRGEDYVLWW